MLSALGRTTFEDASVPVPGKSEFGMDTLTREMEGYVGENGALLKAFVQGLNQGDTYLFGDILFYLQTWQSNNVTPIATVTLNYKGLEPGGTPEPDAKNEMVSAVGSTSQSFSGENFGLGRAYRRDLVWTVGTNAPTGTTPEDIYGISVAYYRTRYTTGATMQFTYRAVQTTYRYITIGRPIGPRFSVVALPHNPDGTLIYNPVLDQVRIVLSDGQIYGRQEIGNFELTPAGTERAISHESQNVIGSPYFECTDIVRFQLEDETI